MFIAALARKHSFHILSDEIYARILYQGQHLSIASLPGMAERTIVLDGFSKTYAMTGWRLGYAVWPGKLYDYARKLAVNLHSCVNASAQYAGLAALKGPQDEVAKMAGEFDRRRRVIVEGLNAIPGVRCVMPKGAFYAFANVSGLFGRTWTHEGRTTPLKGSLDVAAFLLEQARVAVVPGLDFGSDAHVRLSYATSDALISDGLARMGAAIKTLG